MVDLTDLINAVIALIGALLTWFFIPWLKARTTESERQNLENWARIAVAAAQQLYWQSDGETRKQWVLDFLEERGFNIEDEKVSAAIEAAVMDLHRGLTEE